MISYALGIPHTPWVDARAKSVKRVAPLLEGADYSKLFDERESNRVWPTKMWKWALATGASHFVTVQDDTLPAPFFWPALRAMTEARPDAILGLSAVHPLGREVARQGHRWYRTRSWVVGWAYAMPTGTLCAFLDWCDRNPAEVAAENEDSLINRWVSMTGREVWHPVPTLIDHDTSIESTYDNDAHVHRQATLTWRGYAEADLCSADFWRTSGPFLELASTHQCYACMSRPVAVGARGVGLCKPCLLSFNGAAMGVPVSFAPAAPGAEP
jgi:hypothetical protein